MVCFNLSGNAWAEPHRLAVFPSADSLSSVQVLDLLGTGTACLVWSSPLPADAEQPLRYVDVLGSTKPHLLRSYRNNLGAETRVRYAPSTQFYVRDKLAGRPWVTRLPYPVQVVERVEVFDWIGRSRLVTRYAYHNGFFDGHEREFRGFGLVEQWDTEEHRGDTHFDGLQSENWDEGHWTPPIHTKTWFHTGAFVESGAVSRQFAAEYWTEPGLAGPAAKAMVLPDTRLPESLSAEEAREACRALKGTVLRQETYGPDGSPRAANPYSVSEQNYAVRLLQPKSCNRHAVFYVHPRERVFFHYERDPADPRVSHEFVLEVDDFGNVRRRVEVGYPRRGADLDPEPRLGREVRRMLRYDQTRLRVLATEDSYTNALADSRTWPDVYRGPLPAEMIAAELTGYAPVPRGQRVTALFRFEETESMWQNLWSGRYDVPFEDLPAADIDGAGAPTTAPSRRILERSRVLYRSDDLTRLLSLGILETRALIGETYDLVLTDSLVARVLGGDLEETLRSGGYVRLPDGDGWWAPSGRIFYSAGAGDAPSIELGEARRHFFLPRRMRDPFDAISRSRYDSYDLLVTASIDALGNTTEAVNDYRVLQPFRVTDPNGNRAEVAYDILGFAVGGALMGKADEQLGDSLAGFEQDLDEDALIRCFTAPLSDPAAVLRYATWSMRYDVWAFYRTRGEDRAACAVYTLQRETHVSDLAPGETSRYQHSFSFWDGFGREAQRKALAAPERMESAADEVSPRWLASGWTIYNNKGAPVRQYEPFFTTSHRFEFGRRAGVSTVIFYDPLQRVVARLRPDNAWEKTIFDGWRREIWDTNDTVLISDPREDPDVGPWFRLFLGDKPFVSWYERRLSSEPGEHQRQVAAERDAALKAAVHAATPTVLHFDTLGRVCLSVADNGERGRYPSRTVQDLKGRTLALFDAQVRRVLEYCLREAGPDGQVAFICGYDMAGNPLYRNGIDEGFRRTLLNVASNLLRTWDARGHLFRTELDLLQRPTHLYVRTDNGPEILLERYVYGEALPQRNLRGQLFRQYDGVGLLTNERYDFKGNLLESARQFAREYREAVDWSSLAGLTKAEALDAAAVNYLVSGERFVTRTWFDALDRPVQTVAPHSESMLPSVQRLGYDEGGLLARIDVWLHRSEPVVGPLEPSSASLHAVRGIEYNARGQRLRTETGNGVSCRYEYDPMTFRLRRIRTTRHPAPEDGRVLQDLAYTYDPVGNVTFVYDSADIQNVIFFRNQRVEPSSDYTYDAIYRLTRATGREHAGLNGLRRNPPRQITNDDSFNMRLPIPSDGRAMTAYEETYYSDSTGNIEAMVHRTAAGGWTRRYSYAEPSQITALETGNRLSSTSLPGDRQEGPFSGRYAYDPHGNMISMPHLQRMEWDEHDRLRATVRQIRHEGTSDTTYYLYDASGDRKRKVTDSAAAASQVPARRKERLYFGGLELYREYSGDGSSLTLVCETLHVMAGLDRIALVETRTMGTNRAPRQLARYQHGNNIGSAILEVDGEARIISYEEYFPYGSTSYQAIHSQVETPKRYRYTGKERDEENDLYYHGKRYYAPWLGRWTAADPAGNKDGLNLYQYVSGNPVRLMDPQGMGGWDRFWGGVKMVGGALETAAGATLVAAGAATSEIGVGIPIAAAGVFVTAHGADVTVSGARTMWNGAPVDTFTSQGLQAAGMSRTTANLADAGISMVGTLGAGALTRAPGVVSTVAETASATEGTTQTASSVSLAFKPGVLNPAGGYTIGHNMVGVTTEAGTEWTHLVADVTGRTSGLATSGVSEVASSAGPGASYVIVTVPRTAAQAEAALATARASVGTVGEYALGANDCASYAASVLRAGGVATTGLTPAGNFFSVALQSPAVVGPIAATGTAVATAVGADVLYSSDAPDSGMPADAASSPAPAATQASPYTPADSSGLVCTPDDATQNYQDLVCTP